MRCDPRFLGQPLSCWSLPKLRDYLIAAGRVTTVSVEAVRRILHECGVSWQTSKARTDPDFTASDRRRDARTPARPDLCPPTRLDMTGALYWAASQLHLPTLADSGYEGAGQGIHTPYEQPADGRRLAPDSRTCNAILRSMRVLVEITSWTTS